MATLIVVSTIWFMVLASTILLMYYTGAHPFQQALVSGQAARIPPKTVSAFLRHQHHETTAVVVATPLPVTLAPELAPGTLVKGYLVQALLGMGGFARVYLAEQHQTGYRVALKVFGQRNAWRYERRMLARVAHPAFPRLLGAFRYGHGYALVLEYAPGVDLDHLLEKRGVLALGDVLDLGVQLAEALTYLHGLRRPIIHRDVNPGSVRLTTDGRARLLDVGIAQRAGRPGPFVGWGTREYMAPEALAQRPCLESDIYALGVLLWEVLAGEQPCPIAGIYPALPAWQLPGLSVLLQRMVALDAAKRPSAATVLVELSWLCCLAEARAAA